MLDDDFCSFLEYRLTSAFENSSDTGLKGFWCDGVLLPLNDYEYSKKFINDNREIFAKAYIGKTGQDEYKLLIKFGEKSLSRYARDLSIKESIPDAEEKDWYKIDIENKQIAVQLH